MDEDSEAMEVKVLASGLLGSSLPPNTEGGGPVTWGPAEEHL